VAVFPVFVAERERSVHPMVRQVDPPLARDQVMHHLAVPMRDIHRLDEEGFIPSIFNYCDRWCERCDFVDRCRVGIHELDAMEGGFKQRSLDEAIKEMQENLASTVTLLHDMARQHGFDLNDVLKDTPENRAAEREWEERKKAARDHPICAAAMDYATKVHAWMAAHRHTFEQAIGAMTRRAEMGVAPGQQLDDAQRLGDALELLERYCLPVASKIDRAMEFNRPGFDGEMS
jgi:hypothetical protein